MKEMRASGAIGASFLVKLDEPSEEALRRIHEAAATVGFRVAAVERPAGKLKVSVRGPELTFAHRFVRILVPDGMPAESVAFAVAGIDGVLGVEREPHVGLPVG